MITCLFWPPRASLTDTLSEPDVATDAPRRDREVNADCVLFGGVHRLKCAWNRGSIGRHKGGGYGPRPRAHAGTCGWAHALARMS